MTTLFLPGEEVLPDVGHSETVDEISWRYPGGKNGSGVFHSIINQIPPHRIYVELFTGSAAIARRKKPAERTVLVERDEEQFRILEASLKLPGLQLIHGDAFDVLRCSKLHLGPQGFTRDTFVYVDPPYLLSATATQTKCYQNYIGSAAEHRELIDLLRRLSCMVAISGYTDSLYALALADWRLYTYTGCTRGGPKEECLWMNYPTPVELHDYRYLGANYREREIIKRQKARWLEKLRKMQPLRRYALLSTIAEFAEEARPAGSTIAKKRERIRKSKET